MPDSTPTPESQNAQAETDDLGSEESAVAALMQTPTEEVETQEAEPADEPESESDEEAQEADPAEEEETDKLVEVEIDGKTYKVPEELHKGNLRQAEFSRKMNEVSAKEKAYEQGIEEVKYLKETAEKRAEMLAEVRVLDQQIKSFDGIDWAKAQAANPGEAAMAAVRLLTLQNQRKEAMNTAAQVAGELTKAENKLLDEQRAAMFDALKKDVKGWGEDLGAKLTTYAAERGIAPGELSKVTNPAWVKVLNDAMAYQKLKSSVTDLKAKAKDAPPVLKPGAPRKPDVKSDAMARLRKSSSEEDAVAVFLSRK